MSHLKNIAVAGCAALIIAIGASGIAYADGKETVIHDFIKPTGENPKIGPVIDASTGAIYGATWAGGTKGHGVIYQLLPPTAANTSWGYSVIYNNTAQQSYVIANNGVVYVSADYGGAGCGTDCGAIFSLTPPTAGGGDWVSTILYSFTGGVNGHYPEGPLVIDAGGALYGTAFEGGTGCAKYRGCGTVFKLAPPHTLGNSWGFSVLFHFPGGSGGQQPSQGVIFDTSGNLYGVVPFVYASNKTEIFKLTPPSGTGEWTESVLYKFYPKSNCYPSGSLAIDSSGALYGVFSAYGAPETSVCNDSENEYVFQLAPSASNPNVWVKTSMHTFTNSESAAGYELTAPLTVNAAGHVYGATIIGGASNAGTIFVLKPRPGVPGKWNYTALFDFKGGDGNQPNGGLVFDSAGYLYGTTQYGGSNHGTVFSLAP